MLPWLQGQAENRRGSYLRALRALLSEKNSRDIEALDMLVFFPAVRGEREGQ